MIYKVLERDHAGVQEIQEMQYFSKVCVINYRCTWRRFSQVENNTEYEATVSKECTLLDA